MNRITDWFQAEPDSKSIDARRFIRERILTVVLVIGAILGVIAYIVNIRTTIQENAYGWIAIYTLALAWICAIAFIRRIPYEIRVISLLVLFYILGIVSALQFGAAGDSRIWFAAAAILAGLFLGLRAGIVATLITTGTFLSIGFMMNQEILAVPDTSDILRIDNIVSWTTTAVPYFAISLVIVVSVGLVINSLNTSLQRNRNLADELAFDRKQLQLRSEALERREIQIRAAAEISRVAVAELDPKTILQRVANLVQTRFSLYYVGIFILDPSGHYAVLRAGTGEAGQKMIERNHRLPVGSTSMIGYAISNQEARIASDAGSEAQRFDNPDLPFTRSELALPMISAGRVLGAMSVQSTVPDAFDNEDIIVLQGVADSLATALENANLFQQVQASLEEVQVLHRQYLLQAWSNIVSQSRQVSYTYERELPLTEQIIQTADLPPTTLEFPLILRDQAIGNLIIEADRSTLTPQEKTFIEAVTQQTAQALENIRLVQETQRTAQQERVVSVISEELSRSMDVETVIKTAVREIGRLPNVSEVSVHIEPSTTK